MWRSFVRWGWFLGELGSMVSSTGSQKMFQVLSHCKSLFPIQKLWNDDRYISFESLIISNSNKIIHLWFIIYFSYLHSMLTYSSDAQEKASVAEIIFRCFEFPRPLKCGQFLTNGTSIWQCITWKILQQKSGKICNMNKD